MMADAPEPQQTPEWSLLFVLPNLNLEREQTELSLPHVPHLAIVSASDSRVMAIRSWSPAAEELLNSFYSELGSSIVPAVLIGHRDWLAQSDGSPDAIVSFRNSIALSNVLLRRAASEEASHWGAAWTDTFDFHPAQLAIDGSRVDLFTPALTHGHVPLDKLLITTDAGIPRVGDPLIMDRQLQQVLGRAWALRYTKGQDVRFTRALFRSLEIAYLAASIRFKNYGSIHEVGIGAALWVSALEVLASPAEVSKTVSKALVLDLLGQYEWDSEMLAKLKYRVVTGRKNGRVTKRRSVNLVQRTTDHLYVARNRFLHGDRISRGLLQPFTKNGAPGLLSLASTVYRIALQAYLERRWPRERWSLRDEIIYGVFAETAYKEHLRRVEGEEEEG